MTDNLAPRATRAFARLTAKTWYDDLEYYAPCMRCEHPAVQPEDLQEADDRDALARAIARERGQPYTRQDLERDLEAERAEALKHGRRPCGLSCRLWLVRVARDVWADAQLIVRLLDKAVQAAQEGQWREAFGLAQRAMDIERDWADPPMSHHIWSAIRRDWLRIGGS